MYGQTSPDFCFSMNETAFPVRTSVRVRRRHNAQSMFRPSISMPGWPVIKYSAGGRLSLPRQEVLSPLAEGGVGVVEACRMIKKNNEEKHRF